LFWRTEYRYAYYGNHAISDTNPTTGVSFTNINFKPQVQTITTELVYKFGAPGAPVYRAPAKAIAANWNGAYVTGGAGYGVWAADETTSAVPGAANAPIPVLQRQGGKGWLGRIGGGYDYQISHRIIAGVLADFDFSRLKGTIEDSGAGLAGTTRQDWAWAAGARAGWLVTPSILSYVNAGYTMAHFTGTTMFFVATAAPFGGFTTPSFTADGWFLGGGVEAQLSGGWFWRNEYRYASYGSESVSDTSPLAGALIRNNINFKPDVQTITTQLVYKFATQ
jgi:outer membrane immunogenic protein